MWCISEHKNRFGTLQTDTGRRGAVASTKTVWETSRQKKGRRGAVASTEQTWDHPDRQCLYFQQVQVQT